MLLELVLLELLLVLVLGRASSRDVDGHRPCSRRRSSRWSHYQRIGLVSVSVKVVECGQVQQPVPRVLVKFDIHCEQKDRKICRLVSRMVMVLYGLVVDTALSTANGEGSQGCVLGR